MFVIVDHLQIEDHSELELSKVIFHEDHLKFREIFPHERIECSGSCSPLAGIKLVGGRLNCVIQLSTEGALLERFEDL